MKLRNISDVEKLLESDRKARELHEIWNRRRPVADSHAKKSAGSSTEDFGQIAWLDDLGLVRAFIAQALRCEEFLLVLDAAREIFRASTGADENDSTTLVRIRMDYAAALTRLGFLREARLELEPCVAEDFQPVLGSRIRAALLLQLGDVCREEWHSASDRTVQLTAAQQALRYFEQACLLNPKEIDALVRTASTAFLLGHEGEEMQRRARETATRILELTQELDADGPRRKTRVAEAIAYAILERAEDARQRFAQLQGMPGITTPELAAARFESRLLAEAMGAPRDFFRDAFPPLSLIVFAGHLPDRPGDPPNRPHRFPALSIATVRKALREKLAELQARAGLASAAAGGDLLFTEALRERGGTVNLVLPWSEDEFLKTSVQPYESPGSAPVWEPLFRQALAEAATTREIGQLYEPGEDAGWQFNMEVTAGIALQTARALRLDIQPLVLWDGREGSATALFHSFWTARLRTEPVVVELPRPSEGAGAPYVNAGKSCERPLLHQEVKSMLFADIEGYSKLNERIIPEFVGTFLGRLANQISTTKHPPIVVDTRGDMLVAYFDFARDAGMFALELVEMVEDGRSDWLAKGLYWESRSEGGEVVKNPIRYRIGLHTGPVVMHFDPVVRRIAFTGAHVNRTARIEPITRPGQVYASEEFAAMAELNREMGRLRGSAESEPGFACEFAGTMQLVKDYPGRHRIYRVVPKRVFAIEDLAKAVHELYCEEARARGETVETNTALRPWEELSEDLKQANRAQVADIPNKLKQLGFELTAGGGMRAIELTLSGAQVEEIAEREHDRWMDDRRKNGWKYAPVRDNLRKYHPLLISWVQLSEIERDKDRQSVVNLPRLIEKAGFWVRPL